MVCLSFSMASTFWSIHKVFLTLHIKAVYNLNDVCGELKPKFIKLYLSIVMQIYNEGEPLI